MKLEKNQSRPIDSLKIRNLVKSPTFCSRPFEHVFIGNSGIQGPCCYSQQDLDENDPQSTNYIQNDMSVDGLWNSNRLKKIRQQMIEGTEPKECRTCFHREKSGLSSPRIKFPEYSESNEKLVNRDGTFETNIRSVDLRLGNKCNLKCRMCGPGSSKGLIKEWLNSDNEYMKKRARIAQGFSPWQDHPDLVALFEQLGNDLVTIYLAGGEPALVLEENQFLQPIALHQNCKNINLYLSTNLTILMPNLEEYLQKFKLTKFMCSIDGYGKVNDYIRYPSKWENIESNLRTLIDLRNHYPQLCIEITCTTQSYNILFLKEFIDFLISVGIHQTDIYLNSVNSPKCLSPQHLDNDLKAKAVDELDSILDEEYDNHIISQVQDLKKLTLFPAEQEEIIEFKKWTNYFDRSRGQKFTSLFN